MRTNAIPAHELIRAKPHLHVFPDGTPRLMSLLDQALNWIADELSSRRDAVTLETGYGLTTVLMTLLARKHYSIAPDEPGYLRILEYCKAQGIPTHGLSYHVGFSEAVLPGLDIAEESLDLVLIDGGHGFPTPFVDYAYTFKKIKVGGHLVVDDIQLVTGIMLKEYLQASEEWQLVGHFDCKTSVFRKERHTPDKDWYQQPYLLRMNDQVQRLISAQGHVAIPTLQLCPMLSPKGQPLPELVLKRLKALASGDNAAQMAVFGAGKHTAWLEKLLAQQTGIPAVTAVLDDAPDGKPEYFGRRPVHADRFNPTQVDAILLSSDCLQAQMQARCRTLYGDKVKLVNLYEGLPAGPYQKD